MTRPSQFDTWYMHTLDEKPARVIHWAHNRVTICSVSRGNVSIYATLKEIRAEWEECANDAFKESKREYPISPSDVHRNAARSLLARLGYIRVKVPKSAGSSLRER